MLVFSYTFRAYFLYARLNKGKILISFCKKVNYAFISARQQLAN